MTDWSQVANDAPPASAAPATWDAVATSAPASQQPPTAGGAGSPSAGARASNVPRGFNSAVLGAVGIPVDTAINAANLGKAGLEGGYLLAGKTPPTSLDPDRPGTSNAAIPMSSDWLRQKFAKYFGDQTSMQNPKDTASRYLYAAGTALPAAMANNPTTLRQAVTGVAGTALSGAGGEAGKDVAHALGAGPVGEMAGQMLGQGMTGAVAGRVAQPLAQPNAVRQQAVDTYQNAGIPVDAAQRTGNELLRKVNSGLSDNPLTTSFQKGFKHEQEEGANRLMLRTVGENESTASQQTMERAHDRITGVMDDVADRTRIPYDTQLENDLTSVEHRIEREVPDSHKGLIRTQINDILQNAAANKTNTPAGPVHWIDGGTYQKITSSLRNLARNPDAQPVVEDVQSALMDALQRGANPDDVAALSNARRQYRNMKQIEPAVSKEGEGNISPSLVTNQQATKRNRNQSVRGQGDQSLVGAARSARLLQADLPNSGTPSRIMAAALPGVLGGGLGALVGHHTGEMSLGTLAGAAASQYGTLAAMHSPLIGKYLAHGVKNPYIRGLLDAPSSAPYRATIPAQALIDRYAESDDGSQ